MKLLTKAALTIGLALCACSVFAATSYCENSRILIVNNTALNWLTSRMPERHSFYCPPNGICYYSSSGHLNNLPEIIRAHSTVEVISSLGTSGNSKGYITIAATDGDSLFHYKLRYNFNGSYWYSTCYAKVSVEDPSSNEITIGSSQTDGIPGSVRFTINEGSGH